MKYLLALFAICLTFAAEASNLITASVTITNSTTNGMTFVIGSDTRIFTNVPINPATMVLTNSDITGCGSKTNLFNQIALSPFAQLSLSDADSNRFSFSGPCGYNYSVTMAAGLGTVTYSTQTCSTATPVGVPFSAYYPNLFSRTNVGSQLALDIDNYDTNSTLIDKANTQTITGAKTLNNTNNQIFGIISSLGISGYSVKLTNGVYFTPILVGPTTTNLVNYGNAISSPGTNADGSEQFGLNALALHGSLAVGPSAKATNNGDVAVGPFAFAQGQFTIAIGRAPTAFGDNTIVIGSLGAADGPNDIALGNLTTAIGYSNATVIGYLAAATDNNQIMLGSPGISTVIQNNAKVQTNLTVGRDASISGNFSVVGLVSNLWAIGQNNFTNDSDIAFTRKPISTLAAGNNIVSIGTNAFIEVSGPSAAFTITGIQNGRDGKLIWILNQTGKQMTIANESGSDSTATERILTLGSSSDLVLTNAMVQLIYSGAATRWIVISHNP